MAKLNANYEVLYVIDPSLGEEATAEVVAKFKALMTFTAPAELPAELDRQMRIHPNVMRSLITCNDE